ncbi:MAG: DNA recombination protein RmuC [Alphaproteobacteria bacterium]|nr:MAG: DNA recombination protein RmuC [Alphaproteobacteria bacterium]
MFVITPLIFILVLYIVYLWHEKTKLVIENAKLKERNVFINEELKNFSNQALLDSQKHFLTMAENSFKHFYEKNKAHMESKEKDMVHMIEPISKTLSNLQNQLQTLEKDRIQTSEKLLTQLSDIQGVQKSLHEETAHMRKTFSNSSAKGQWGEIQLKRIVELTGMLEYCDFIEQSTAHAGIRPDMIVRLPDNKCIIIDAKAPMKAYMEALEITSVSERSMKVKEHAKNVRLHIKNLSQKNYWQHPTDQTLSPEFVVLFLPSDAFLAHAIEGDHALLEYGIREKVVIATPTTLIALLKTVFFAWQNYRISDHAKSVCEIGKQLFIKHQEFHKNFIKIGKTLETAVDHYQKTEDHFNKNILPQEKKLKLIMG